MTRPSYVYQYRVRCPDGAYPHMREAWDPNPMTLLSALRQRDLADHGCRNGDHRHKVERRRIHPGPWERCENATLPDGRAAPQGGW